MCNLVWREQYRTFDWGDVVANLSGLVLTIPASVWFWRSRNGLQGQDEMGEDVWDEREEGEGLLWDAEDLSESRLERGS